MAQALQTYNHLHKEKPKFGMDVLSHGFEVKKAVILQNNGVKTKGIPVRFDFYTMILCLKGGSIRNVNQHQYTIAKRSLQLLPPQTIHYFKDMYEDPQYYVLLFEKEFSGENSILAYHDQNFDNVQLDTTMFNKIKELFEEIATELTSIEEDSTEYAKSLVNQLLILLKREKQKQKVDLYLTRSDLICSEFLSLIEKHFYKKKSVSEYAKLMELSSKHLSQTVKNQLGKSALYFIHKRIIKEAKYLLAYSEKNIYDIAIALNFQDASQFIRFFKQKVGTTPKNYQLINKFEG